MNEIKHFILCLGNVFLFQSSVYKTVVIYSSFKIKYNGPLNNMVVRGAHPPEELKIHI